MKQGAYRVTKFSRSSPRAAARGPVVVNQASGPVRPRERLFGGPMPDGPLPGHLLVLLSRLHRAEAAPKEMPDTPKG